MSVQALVVSKSKCISNFREGGLIIKFFKDEMDAVNSAVATDEGQGESPLTLENLQGGFLLWIFPIAFTILVFSIEVIIFIYWIKLIAIFKDKACCKLPVSMYRYAGKDEG